MKYDWTAIGALATAAAAIASFILAGFSFRGIKLANKGVRVSEASIHLARRDYLDDIISSVLTTAAKFQAYGLPLWSKQYEAGSEVFVRFHTAYIGFETALNMLEITGLAKTSFAPSEPSYSNMDEIIEMIRWSMMAHYLSLDNDPAWEGTFDETWERLKGLDKGSSISDELLGRIKGIFDGVRERYETSLDTAESRDNFRTDCKNFSCHLLDLLVSELSDEYKEVAMHVAPWYSADKDGLRAKIKMKLIKMKLSLRRHGSAIAKRLRGATAAFQLNRQK